MSAAAKRAIRLFRGPRAWTWFIGLAFAWGVLIVTLAFTVHDQGSPSDPDQVFHSYTLVQADGAVVLAIVGAPLVISLVLARLLHAKTARRSARADRAASIFAGLSCLCCIAGLLNAGVVMVPEAVLTICAVATAPFPPDPNDPLVRSPGTLQRLPPLN
jgi:Na+/proline symporter